MNLSWDIDFSTRALNNDVNGTLQVVREVARIKLDDGILFDADQATAETIRESDDYSGVCGARQNQSGYTWQ